MSETTDKHPATEAWILSMAPYRPGNGIMGFVNGNGDALIQVNRYSVWRYQQKGREDAAFDMPPTRGRVIALLYALGFTSSPTSAPEVLP